MASPAENEKVVRDALNESANRIMELKNFATYYAAVRPKFERRFGDRAWNGHLGPGYRALAALCAQAEAGAEPIADLAFQTERAIAAEARLADAHKALRDQAEPIMDERFRDRLLRHVLSNEEVRQLVDAIESREARARAALAGEPS